jgi:hypothetical protein
MILDFVRSISYEITFIQDKLSNMDRFFFNFENAKIIEGQKLKMLIFYEKILVRRQHKMTIWLNEHETENRF